MKFKIRSVFFLSSFLFLYSCAGQQVAMKSAHHHHSWMMEKCQMKHKCEMYNKKCAASVAHGDFHVEGKEDFLLTHNDHNYFFSSKEKMKEFQKNLERNIEKSDAKWIHFENGLR